MSENGSYEVGYGKPPVNRQFGKPDGNPAGKTSEAKRLEYSNAEKAMRIREMLLDAAGSHLEGLPQSDRIGFIEAAMLKLLTDSEMRGLGAPKQAVDHTSSDGSMAPTTITLRAADDDKRDS